MGIIVSSWSEVLVRYPELDKLAGTQIAANRDALIAQGEAYVHGKLSANFTIPFSNNNLTAKDLVFDAIYMQNIQARQPVKGKTIATVLEEKFIALCTGKMQMVNISGTIAQTATGDPAWSNTMGYHPTFGMGNEVMMAVNSQMLIDENDARNDPSEEAY
jgi:hypothetical protein